MTAMWGPESIWTALLTALLITHCSQPAAAQKSVPVTTTNDFANALKDQTITEIILDPSGTGVGGGTFVLRGDLWVSTTFDIAASRDLTVRSVNGNPTMLDLGGIPSILEIRANATLELRDMLLKNVATEKDLRAAEATYVRPEFLRVSGMLAWPSFSAEPGATLRIYNTTQYFWSNTIFFRPDCNFKLAGPPPDGQKVKTLRGEQTYSFDASGYTLLAESHLYHAQYPVLTYSNGTSQPEGFVDVYSENSYGICVPVNSSANNVIIGMARATALASSGGSGNRQTAIAIASAVGAIVGAALIGGLIGLAFWVRRKRRQDAVRDLSDLGTLLHSEGAPMLAAASTAPSTTTANTQMESHLLQHSRLRRLGALDEEQVEVGPLLGRGSFGRVYKGRWRSTLVAIKVVEHSPGARESMSLAEQKIEREALLATSLSHPNIIATFKICTMTAGSAVGQKKASMGMGSGSLRRPSDLPSSDHRQSNQTARLESLQETDSRAQHSGAASPEASLAGAASLRTVEPQQRKPNEWQHGMRELGSGNSEGRPSSRPSSQPSSQPGSRNEGRVQSRVPSQQGSKGKGSAESFDPSTAFVVDLPKSDTAVVGEQKKGSDSAINNGGMRPGLAGASPTATDIEMTEGELAAEDEEAAIEERMSRLLETWCLMEYAEKGSLADALRTGRLKRPCGFPELGVIIACLQDIASGMEYLHSAGILHGDLKPANVLLKSTSADRRGFLCKLCDFGMSRLLDATHATHVSTQTYGTMPYMPPELLAQSQLTPKADVYSFGIVMWELLSGQMPFANLTVGQVFFAVVHEKARPPLDMLERARQDLPEEDEQGMLDRYKALMTSCWAEIPAHRPSFPQIVSELGTFRAKISMRLSSKPSDGLGLRKISSVRSGVASPTGGLASPSQPESQRAMPPLRPSSPPADEQSGLNLLRSPSFEKKTRPAQGLSEGPLPAGLHQRPGVNLERDPVSINSKSVSLRDYAPFSRAQLLSSLGARGGAGPARPDAKQGLSLKDLPDNVRDRLAASQKDALPAAANGNSSEQTLQRQPLAKKSPKVVAERSFSF